MDGGAGAQAPSRLLETNGVDDGTKAPHGGARIASHYSLEDLAQC